MSLMCASWAFGVWRTHLSVSQCGECRGDHLRSCTKLHQVLQQALQLKHALQPAVDSSNGPLRGMHSAVNIASSTSQTRPLDVDGLLGNIELVIDRNANHALFGQAARDKDSETGRTFS